MGRIICSDDNDILVCQVPTRPFDEQLATPDSRRLKNGKLKTSSPIFSLSLSQFAFNNKIQLKTCSINSPNTLAVSKYPFFSILVGSTQHR